MKAFAIYFTACASASIVFYTGYYVGRKSERFDREFWSKLKRLETFMVDITQMLESAKVVAEIQSEPSNE